MSEDIATAISVRLPPAVLAQVDRFAADGGMKRSDVIRELVTEAIASRASDSAKAAKRKKP